jgi:hypothetical protein
LRETIQKEKKRSTDAASTEPKKTMGKKVPEMYLVNSRKFASEATEEELIWALMMHTVFCSAK